MSGILMIARCTYCGKEVSRASAESSDAEIASVIRGILAGDDVILGFYETNVRSECRCTTESKAASDARVNERFGAKAKA